MNDLYKIVVGYMPGQKKKSIILEVGNERRKLATFVNDTACDLFCNAMSKATMTAPEIRMLEEAANGKN